MKILRDYENTFQQYDVQFGLERNQPQPLLH